MAGKMLKMQNLFYVCFLLLLPRKLECLGAEMTNFTCEELDCQPNEICVCQGSDVTIPWVIPYQDDFLSADWSFNNSINVTTIASSASIDDAVITDSFNVKYNGNGSITLTSVTPENTGVYKCAVAYNLFTHSSITGTVTISVYDAPTGLNFTSTLSGNDINFQCTTAYYGFTAASLSINVDGTNVNSDKASVKKDKARVECCLTGSSVRCMEGISVGCSPETYCISVQRSCGCWCWWGCCYDDGMCILCWLVFILMICIMLYIVGIIIGVFLKYTECCCKCFYHCKDSDCCECCGGNTCVCCKCCTSLPCGVLCNINQLPFWYQILLATVIGILPVVLGIYTIWRCFGREEVRYVVVEHDGNRSLGFTHGSVIITSVTPGGPADKKLKVGEHVRKIGEDSTEGKTLDEIHKMLNNRTSPTLTVSEVGSDNTRSVVMTYTQEEPLGFVVNTHTMITEVQRHGPADGKLKVGERILSINGKSTVNKTCKEIKKWLKPTSIKLTVEKVSGRQEESVDYDKEASLGIEIEKNQNQQIVVSTVGKKSPAYRKIHEGDIILKVKGESTESMTIAEVRKKMKSSVEFKVTKDVTLLELDPDRDGSIGLEICPASMVTSVTPGGRAATAGIKEEDIILKINGTPTDGMNRNEILNRIEASKPNLTIVTNQGNIRISRVTGPVGIDTTASPNIVWKLAPNGPAEQSRKVKHGQRILSINGEDTDGMSQDEIREVLHLSMKSVTLKLGEGSSPDAKHTATSKSHPPNTRSSKEKPADQLPLPEISHADGAYGGGKDRIEIENESVSYSKQKLPPVPDVPGHDIHEKLQGIPKKELIN